MADPTTARAMAALDSAGATSAGTNTTAAVPRGPASSMSPPKRTKLAGRGWIVGEPFYTCCEDGMLSRVPPTDRSGLCPACKPSTAPQPLLTDEDWQAVADKHNIIIAGRVKASIEERIRLRLAASPAVVQASEPASPSEPKVHCHVCPAKPDEYCERNCLDVIADCEPAAPTCEKESGNA